MSSPNFNIVSQFTSLIDIIEEHAHQYPDYPAFKFLEDGEQQVAVLTYAELDRKARMIAVHLQQIDRVGERALLLYPPGLEYITAFLGCMYAGIVAIPAYPPDISRLDRSLPRFLSIIHDAHPKFVLTTAPILAMTQVLLTQYPDLPAMDWLASDVLAVAHQELSLWQHPDICYDSLAFLQYTSGSTADPKGVMLSHGNLMENLGIIAEAFQVDLDQDKGMFWLPFYHDMGLIGGILETIFQRRTTILMSPLDFLQRPYRWLNAISTHRATISGGPNFAYDLCVSKVTEEQKQTLDLSCWLLAASGAEPVRWRTLERFADAFAVCGFRKEAFYPCYGLAEATLLVTGVDRGSGAKVLEVDSKALGRHLVIPAQPNSENISSLVSCGHSWGGQVVTIVDPESHLELQPDESGVTAVGEVWVSGPSVAAGYWGRSADSHKIFSNRLPAYPERTFLRTGDLGFLKDGELYIAGRIKDLIIIDGKNHYPQDIELTVENCHPALRHGCSAAFSIEEGGQERLVVAVEVARSKKLAALEQDGLNVSSDKLRDVIRQAVSSHHDLRVSAIALLKAGSIPKTSSGKIQRQACKAGYLSNQLDLWQP
jgi:acyl-CoA synthetase (AMP-forming)/AMP-acid ligase II